MPNVRLYALLLVALAPLGCRSTPGPHDSGFRCDVRIRQATPEELSSHSSPPSRPVYVAEFTLHEVVGAGSALRRLATPVLTCLEDERSTIAAGDWDALGQVFESVSDGWEIVVIVPSEQISEKAIVRTRVRRDNLTVWAHEQKVPVDRQASETAWRSDSEELWHRKLAELAVMGISDVRLVRMNPSR